MKGYNLNTAVKFVTHAVPVLFFFLGHWLTGMTFLALVFIFYVKTFKLEVYKRDLEEKGAADGALINDIQVSIDRWKAFTFLDEFRGDHDRSQEP